MAYTCETCGVVAESPEYLCNPSQEEMDRNVCGDTKVNTAQMCRNVSWAVEYSCIRCGRLASEASLLCEASPIV